MFPQSKAAHGLSVSSFCLRRPPACGHPFNTCFAVPSSLFLPSCCVYRTLAATVTFLCICKLSTVKFRYMQDVFMTFRTRLRFLGDHILDFYCVARVARQCILRVTCGQANNICSPIWREMHAAAIIHDVQWPCFTVPPPAIRGSLGASLFNAKSMLTAPRRSLTPSRFLHDTAAPSEAMWRQEEQTTRPILGLACTCYATPSSPARPGLRVLQSPAAPQGNEHIRQQVAGAGAVGGRVWTPARDTLPCCSVA